MAYNKEIFMNSTVLNNGIDFPIVGLGTFDLPKDRISEIIGNAYKLGYRRFDTAAKYNNEIEIGKALKENNIKREDVFIQTKIDCQSLYFEPYRYGRGSIFNIRRPKTISSFIEDSFKRLNTDYVDMFLIHWPAPKFLKIYKALEAFYKEGKIRAIGVCSFLPPHIDYILDNCEIIPSLNQFEISPLNTQKRLIEYCKAKGIQPEAMSTFSHFRSSQPRMEILQNPTIMRIAEAHKKTVAQIVNRWLVQQGVAIVPKSKNPLHLNENISIFDFELTEDEMTSIDSLDKGKFLNYDPTLSYWGLPAKYMNKQWFS